MTITDDVPELALTLIQPMGWAIVAGYKSVENRGRNIMPLALRGKRFRAAIHNGLKWDERYEKMVKELTRTVPAKQPMAIIGVATFTGRVYTDLEPPRFGSDMRVWYMGPFGFEIVTGESVLFDTPIPCRGMLGFWRLNPSQRADVQHRLALVKSRAALAVAP